MTVERNLYSGGYVRPERFETEPFNPTPYQYILVNTLTQDLIAEVPFTGVSWSLGVSKAGDFSGTLQFTGEDVVPGLDLYAATLPIKTSIYVFRNGKVVWGGIIWGRSYSLSSRQLNISAASFESYLFRRYIWHTLTFLNTVDQYDVARGLIDAMQTDFDAVDVPTDPVTPQPLFADIGITYQSALSGKTQDRQLWEGGSLTSFGDALGTFANNLNGFEWNIVCDWNAGLGVFTRELQFRDTPPGQMPTGVEFTGTRTGLDSNIFEWPGSIQDIGLDESGDTTSLRYYVVGGAPEGVESDYRPVGAWDNQQYLNDGWPLVEVVESSKHDSVVLPATLEKYAQVYGRRTRPVVPTWNVVVNGSADPEIGTYVPGDWCRLVINDEFIAARLASSFEYTQDETVKRIMGYSVSVPDVPQEPEMVTLELADEWVDPEGA